MKILSNFDTELDEKVYHENVLKYGKENIVMVFKDRVFLYLSIVIPASIYIIMITFLFIMGFYIDVSKDMLSYYWLAVLIFSLLLLIVLGLRLMKKYIDYKMDFTVVNPEQIISYNQTGFLSRESKSVGTGKIKTITILKKGLIRSFFNYGSLVFLSEGDDTGKGDITLHYVQNPDELRTEIKKIIDFGRSQGVAL